MYVIREVNQGYVYDHKFYSLETAKFWLRRFQKLDRGVSNVTYLLFNLDTHEIYDRVDIIKKEKGGIIYD